MTDELETLLRLVAAGRLTPEEAAPLVARLQRDTRPDPPSAPGRPDPPSAPGRPDPPSAPGRPSGPRIDRREGDGKRGRGWAWNQREPIAQKALADRRLKILVREYGRDVVNLAMPLAAAGYAIDRIPGLSDDDRMRIAEAIRSGMTGSIVEARDDDDEVRITIE